MYYLVDTNIIISYMNSENPVLQEYINNSSNFFYYTETVQKEVFLTDKSQIPQIFRYMNSGMTDKKKEIIYSNLKDFFVKVKDDKPSTL